MTIKFRCAVGLQLLRDSNVVAEFIKACTCRLLGMLFTGVNLCESTICVHKGSSALCDGLGPGRHPVEVPLSRELRGVKVKVVNPVSPVDGMDCCQNSLLRCGFEHLVGLIETNVHDA